MTDQDTHHRVWAFQQLMKSAQADIDAGRASKARVLYAVADPVKVTMRRVVQWVDVRKSA
jgi:hypothetical protein